LPVSIYLAVSVWFILKLASLTHGHNFYTIDDAYIHMAISKNFALYGVYGITKYYFSNASSSPLWTFMISGMFKILGLKIWIPLLLASAFAILDIFLIYRIFKERRVPLAVASITSLLLIFLTSMWGLTFTGLEHLLQIGLMLMILYISTDAIFKDRRFKHIVILSALASIVRPETWALIVGVAFLFLISGRWKKSILYLGLSFLPVVAFGIWSVSHGNGFFPNTYYLKGMKGKGFTDLIFYVPKLTHISAQASLVLSVAYLLIFTRPRRSLRNFIIISLVGFAIVLLLGMFNNLPAFISGGIFVDRYYLTDLTALVFAVALLLSKIVAILLPLDYKRRNLNWSAEDTMSYLLFIVLIAHFHRGGFGWFFRYEAYLIFLTIAILPILMRRVGVLSLWHRLGLLVISIPLVIRGFTVLKDIVPAVQITYLKNYNLAVFVKKHFNGIGIALDDIGYVSFLSEAKVVDFVGLGTYDVARAIYEGKFNTSTMRALAKKYDIKLAILRPSWYVKYGGLPGEWLVVGTWKVPDIYYPGSNFLTVMAVDSNYTDTLIRYLQEASSYLPPEVDIRILPPTPLGKLMR